MSIELNNKIDSRSLVFEGTINDSDLDEFYALWLEGNEKHLVCKMLENYDTNIVTIVCHVFHTKPKDPEDLSEYIESVRHEGRLCTGIETLWGSEWTGQYGISETFKLINKQKDLVFDFFEFLEGHRGKYVILDVYFYGSNK